MSMLPITQMMGLILGNRKTQVDHSVSYQNRTAGFDPNGGQNVLISYVTAWNNGSYGIYAYPTTTIDHSISTGNFNNSDIVGSLGPTTGTQTNNSWQRAGTVTFISTDPVSSDFLRPAI